MNTWFTSDLHLGHKGVITYCNRPFASVEEMDETLLNNYNLLVAPHDVVYWCGDVSFHKPRTGVPLLARFNGSRILVQGNHDKYSTAQYAEAGFKVQVRELALKLEGQKYRLCHYPAATSEELAAMTDHRKYEERRPTVRPYETLLCGHVHQAWQTKNKMINVGVDVWNYRPVSLKEIQRVLPKSL